MKTRRGSLLVVVVVAGLLVALPGLAETVESMMPGDDCTDDCPADDADGKCGSSCDECTCCARTLAAVLLPSIGPGSPGRIDSDSPTGPVKTPLVLPQGVYHPPRA